MTSYGTIPIPKDHVLADYNPRFRMSSYLQELICWVGQEAVFDKGSEVLEKLSHIEICDKQIERVSTYYGSLLEAQEWEAVESGAPHNWEEESAQSLHYAMFDGAQFLFREQKWKEAKLGRIFEAKSHMAQSERRNWVRDSVYVAHFGDCKAFFSKFERYLDRLEKLVFIADGAPWIWDWVDTHYPDQVQILDWFHALENLGNFAVLYFKDKTERKEWIKTQESHLWEDQVERVIATLEELLPAKNKEIEQKRKRLIGYYLNNQKRMKYKTFKEQGLMIGSGPIEAAHRHVMQQRLKLSGQRWSPNGFQAIANLRTAEKSGFWNNIMKLTNAANFAA